MCRNSSKRKKKKEKRLERQVYKIRDESQSPDDDSAEDVYTVQELLQALLKYGTRRRSWAGPISTIRKKSSRTINDDIIVLS